MKLRLLLILSMLTIQVIVSNVKAADGEKTYSFVVWTHAGSTFSYALDAKPVVTYENEEIVVTTTTSSAVYQATEVAKFTLSDVATSVENVAQPQGMVKNNGNVLTFSSFEPGTRVQVYSVNGIMIANELIGLDGNLEIRVSEYSSGIYVVKTKGITCKIVKK
ncbi:MAG: T9SS type A sorting domain-containing protein [Muribaculaceae bacterium]|nr:T9SS type A sorting domain-containing protein [Muribaculaceae bacterium]